MVTMQRGNFVQLLASGIREQEQREREQGYRGESAYLAGLRAVLEAVRRGEHVEIR